MGTSSPATIEAVATSKVLPAAKRQHRSPEHKRKIVEETLVADASVARVARAHGINANQVFQWRRLYRAGKFGDPMASAARLLPVAVSETQPNQALLAVTADTAAPVIDGEAAGNAPGTIHLELRKARLRIEGKVDPAVLRLVLQSLLG